MGLGVLIPPIFPIFIGLAGRLYNSVSTTVLHCDVEKFTKAYDFWSFFQEMVGLYEILM